MNIRAIVQEADAPDIHNRSYSAGALLRIVTDFEGPMHGWMRISAERTRKIQDASHIVTGVFFDSGALQADIAILDTEPGKRLAELIASDDAVFIIDGEGDRRARDSGTAEIKSCRLRAINAVQKPKRR